MESQAINIIAWKDIRAGEELFIMLAGKHVYGIALMTAKKGEKVPIAIS
jgi:hypothetical protein